MAVRVCEFCGITYEGAAQSRFCTEAHRKAASRQRSADKPAEPRETAPASRPTQPHELIQAARAGQVELTEAEEQFIRDFLGYAGSEKRTLAERDAAAKRMVQQLPAVGRTVTRTDELGREVEETVGPAGLSLKAFPTQTPHDLRPSGEQLKKLG